MGTQPEASPLRRLAAGASLGITAGTFAISGLQEHLFSEARWGLLGLAAVSAVGAVGLLRRAVMTQVLSRGVAWLVLLPSAAGSLAAMLDGRWPPLSAVLVAASSGGALLLGRRALQSADARREFAPVAYRRWFLAGSVSAVTAALVAAFGAAGELLWGSARSGLGYTALAAVLLAAAVGVVRMRAWGVLLGAVTSMVMLGVAMLSTSQLSALAAGLAALPGMLLAAPLVVARLRPPEALPAAAAVSGRRHAEGLPAGVQDEPPLVRARVEQQAAVETSVVEADRAWATSGGARPSRS